MSFQQLTKRLSAAYLVSQVLFCWFRGSFLLFCRNWCLRCWRIIFIFHRFFWVFQFIVPILVTCLLSFQFTLLSNMNTTRYNTRPPAARQQLFKQDLARYTVSPLSVNSAGFQRFSPGTTPFLVTRTQVLTHWIKSPTCITAKVINCKKWSGWTMCMYSSPVSWKELSLSSKQCKEKHSWLDPCNLFPIMNALPSPGQPG